MNEQVCSFRGEMFYRSNMYPSPIVYKNITFKTSEHFYQASKTFDKSAQEVIMNCNTPYLAKKKAQTIKVRSDWDDIKLNIMKIAVYLKFSQNKEIYYLLKKSTDYIEETNYWHDLFWGNCYCKKCNGKGLNHLGKILMDIRK